MEKKNINETLMSDDNATLQKNTHFAAIKAELLKINSATDMLRSVEDERQYNKLQLLLFSICFVMVLYQRTELSNAHDLKMNPNIPKFGH